MDMSHSFAAHDAFPANPLRGILSRYDKLHLLRLNTPMRHEAGAIARPDPDGIDPDHLQNLEILFNDYANGAISIDSYIAKTKGEIAKIKAKFRLVDRIAGKSLFFVKSCSGRLSRYQATLKAAKWCLSWAEQRRQDEFNDCLAAASAKWLTEVEANRPAAADAA
jgi:hypothetical protein